MATLTIRYDIPAPRFVHGFVYEGEETERTALKEAMRKVAAKAGIDTETWLQSVVIGAPKVPETSDGSCAGATVGHQSSFTGRSR
jgi:hypothetical protein